MPYLVLGGNLGWKEAFVWTSEDVLMDVEHALFGASSNRPRLWNDMYTLQGSALTLLNKLEFEGWRIVHTSTVERGPAGNEPSPTQYQWTLFKEKLGVGIEEAQANAIHH
ncbi:hypothetical protein PMAYCL1PPCAC_19786 [Pristionchus mayeri]|uniref:Uncharacterized protein n=1 Tax=Pristionchus mayeri TaxID=1317129 RepID=A0AAN5I3H0_9BILA|nr:hypothetical protein PMAYCL1PPCAC_19786 [Pristionchus mayeri]